MSLQALSRVLGTLMPAPAAQVARDLYIDLLIKVLTNTIYGDPPMSPQSGDTYNPEVRNDGHDWPSQAHTMVGVLRLQNVRDLMRRVLEENIPGDFIETGVWRGGCCILMRGMLAAYGCTNRKVYVADSFAGLPPPAWPQDAGDKHYLKTQLAVPIEEVKSNFQKYDLLDEQVEFVKGFFSDTLKSLDLGPLAILRLDGDMYESTMVALDALYPKLSPGGFVIIDDYALAKSRKAVIDYRDANAITAPITNVDWTGIWWKKPKHGNPRQ